MDDMAATGFGRGADAYDRARPGWPRPAVAAAFERWELEPRGSRVLDLGAGTGRLTDALADLGADVAAVEPVAEMRAHIGLGRALEGTAEDIPLPDEAVDAVLSGEAFHWFDAERAIPEIARVLRPRGGLALLWNAWIPGDEPWRAQLAAVLEDVHYHPQGLSLPSAGLDPYENLRRKSFEPFEPFERLSFEHDGKQLSPEGLCELIASFSFVAALPDDALDALLRRVLDVLEAAGVDRIEQRWRCDAFVTRKTA